MWKKGIQWFFFSVAILMGIGQMPSVIGRLFLILSLLILPVRPVQAFIEEILHICAERWMWVCIILVYMACLPGEEFADAGKRMGLFLREVCGLLGLEQ